MKYLLLILVLLLPVAGCRDNATAPEQPDPNGPRVFFNVGRMVYSTLEDGSDPRVLFKGAALWDYPKGGRFLLGDTGGITVYTPHDSSIMRGPVPFGTIVPFLTPKGGGMLWENDESELWISDLDGSNPHILVNYYLCPGSIAADAVSPDGRLVYFRTPNHVGINVGEIATGKVKLITTDDYGATTARAWSRTGDSLAYVSIDSFYQGKGPSISVARTDGSGWRMVARFPHESTVGNMSWSPDGRTIYFIKDGSLMAMNPDGENIRTVIDGNGHELDAPCDWSADGRKFLFYEDDALRLFDVTTSSVRKVVDHVNWGCWER